MHQPTLFDFLEANAAAPLPAAPPAATVRTVHEITCSACRAPIPRHLVRVTSPLGFFRQHYCLCPTCDLVIKYTTTPAGTIVFPPFASRARTTRAAYEAAAAPSSLATGNSQLATIAV